MLVVIPGGPEGTRAQSHLPLRFFTPSLPGRPPSVMSSQARCFSQRRGFPGRGPYLQTDLTLIPVHLLVNEREVNPSVCICVPRNLNGFEIKVDHLKFQCASYAEKEKKKKKDKQRAL